MDLISDLKTTMMFMAIGKILIFIIVACLAWHFFANDFLNLHKSYKKWEKQQEEEHKQKIELMKAKTEFYKSQGKNKGE